MNVNQKDWSCPKKQQSRMDTIISPYREHFNHSLPKQLQYWTLCGQCATPEGNPLKGCELDQMVQEGLIDASQFHGVEITAEIHQLNASAWPDVHWHNDDLYRAMVVAQSKGWFKPGIVNCDFPKTIDSSAASCTAKILAMLSEQPQDIFFLANFIVRKRFYTSKDGNYIIEYLNKFPQFRLAFSKGWQYDGRYYTYNGTGNVGSRTFMSTFIFVKKTIQK